MARVIRTPLARSDLKEIAAYLLKESRSRGIVSRFLNRVASASKLYASRPELGELCRDLAPGVRRFLIGNYVAFYRPTSSYFAFSTAIATFPISGMQSSQPR